MAQVLEAEEVSLVAEGDPGEVELEIKKSLALSSKKPIKSDINLFYILFITQLKNDSFDFESLSRF